MDPIHSPIALKNTKFLGILHSLCAKGHGGGHILTLYMLVCSVTICSSIHDHTDSHCFMKLLQGQLKETLFDWPQGESQGNMVQKSQRILQENKVAYINGEINEYVLIFRYPASPSTLSSIVKHFGYMFWST